MSLTSAKCNKESVILGDKFRFTVLTPQLLRLEYSEIGYFEDRPTQTVINRNFKTPPFTVNETPTKLEIKTENLRLIYNKKEFSENGLEIHVFGGVSNYQSVWHFGDKLDTLGGTVRTLDAIDGKVELENGIISRKGFSVIDDSNSFALSFDGTLEKRKDKTIDLYFFGYGHAYKKCLKDFYSLCGNMPLLPRYALGNWWSRYHRYSEDEYKKLILKFNEKEIPFSVAVLDMDWHITDVDPKYGSGWTGYTWNTELFPEPKEFLNWLHNKNLKVTLNVHPADGIRAYEKAYPKMAKAMGVDTKKEKTVEFDFTNKKFIDAFFKYVNKPLEDDGVDFWWIDWQQGSVSKISGLDPLWLLNHYYSLNCNECGCRPLILSRYAGLGSHRYPIGFSGDTLVTWKSLKFQPYFTATAANVGYGWWSHDIGGHMGGVRDDELAVRWLQFGVFSPINRLHSSPSEFTSKEPWQYSKAAEDIMEKYLRLRHKLIPYLYSMNMQASVKGSPLLEPLYYDEPENNEAYNFPNEYKFGTEMIVCPITDPIFKNSQKARFKAWLPKGLWIDFFSGRIYEGGRIHELWRGIENIPVLAKAGGIIPTNELTSLENPTDFSLFVFAGSNGSFDIFEDDGITQNYKGVKTTLSLSWNENMFTITPAFGDLSVLPKKRGWKLNFCGFKDTNVIVKVDGKLITIKKEYLKKENKFVVDVPKTDITSEIKVFFENCSVAENNVIDDCFEFLKAAQIENNLKDRIFDVIKNEPNYLFVLASLSTMNLSHEIFSPLCEILSSLRQNNM